MKKTTKLVGAVIGVLLVAALFVGAGAAAVTIDEATEVSLTWTVGQPLENPITGDATEGTDVTITLDPTTGIPGVDTLVNEGTAPISEGTFAIEFDEEDIPTEAGTYTITLKDGEAAADPCVVTVTVEEAEDEITFAPSSVEWDSEEAEISEGITGSGATPGDEITITIPPELEGISVAEETVTVGEEGEFTFTLTGTAPAVETDLETAIAVEDESGKTGSLPVTVTADPEPEPLVPGAIDIAVKDDETEFEVGDAATIIAKVGRSTTNDIAVSLPAVTTVFDYQSVTVEPATGITAGVDDAGNFTAYIPKGTAGDVVFTIKAKAYDVTAAAAGEISGTATTIGGATTSDKVSGIKISPTVEIDGETTILITGDVTLNIAGTKGDEVKITGGSVFNQKTATIRNEDGSLSVTLTPKAKGTTKLTVEENGVTVSTEDVSVSEVTVTLDETGEDALWTGEEQPIEQALEVGNQFVLTLNGGLPGKHYALTYDKKIFHADKDSLAGNESATFVVDAVPKETSVIASSTDLADSGAVPTTEITVEELDDPLTFAITPTVDVSTTKSGEITVTFKGAAKETYWVDSYTIAPEILEPKLAKGQTFDEDWGSVFFPTDANGEATIKYQALGSYVDIPFMFGIGETPMTTYEEQIFDVIETVDVLPTIEVVGTARAGETGIITVSGIPGDTLVFPDTESFYFPAQSGVYKAYDNDPSVIAFGYDYNVFTIGEDGSKLLFVECAPSDRLYYAELPLYSYDAVTGVDEELTSTLIKVELPDTPDDLKTVMAFHPYDKIDDTFTNGRYYLVNDNGIVTSDYVEAYKYGDNQLYFAPTILNEEGIYVNDKGVSVRLLFPAIVVDAKVHFEKASNADTYDYDFWGASFVKDNDGTYSIHGTLDVPGLEDEKITADNIKFEIIDEAGAATKLADSKVTFDGTTFTIASDAFDNNKIGVYALRPYIVNNGEILVPTVADEFTLGDEIPFYLIKEGDVDIVVSSEEIISGTKFVGTITGMPGHDYKVTTGTGVVIPDQKKVTLSDFDKDNKAHTAIFTMPAAGVFDLTLKADVKLGEKDTDVTIRVVDQDAVDKDAEAEVKVLDAIITAETDKDAYTIGDDIVISGTNTSEEPLYFYIEGVNVGFKQIMKNGSALSATSEDWETTVKYDYLKKSFYGSNLDAGTYTVYVSPLNGAEKKDVTDGTYVSIPVTLKQSFITLTSVPEVVAQGGKITIEGTANAAKSVMWYLFGTNYFSAGTEKVKNDEFTITIDKDHTDDEDMAAGQYFLVVQHPMYDNKYSIAPVLNGIQDVNVPYAAFNDDDNAPQLIKESDNEGVYEYKSGTLEYKLGGTTIFDVGNRQTANAAQALCDALDSQNFDDMYAKASFIVGAPTSIVNPIPTKITHGEKLTISGTTTGHVGDIVSVEFLATAFAAVPKEAVGTAAFVTVTTKVQDDGTWEIVFDTSNLNCDDYTVSVAVGQLGPVTAKLTVTEKQVTPTVKPTVQPTQKPTVVPTTAAPTQTPKTPGFGILAALAGLGAVAVLLLRRQ